MLSLFHLIVDLIQPVTNSSSPLPHYIHFRVQFLHLLLTQIKHAKLHLKKTLSTLLTGDRY